MSTTRLPARPHALAALVARGRARARAAGRGVLVSLAEPVPAVDPLAALAALAALAGAASADPRLAAEAGSRMYWARPADGVALAGFGAAATLSAHGTERFAQLDRGWDALIADALVEDPSGGVPGVGPALMGGFAFDPEGPRAERWRGFPGALLVLPRIQLALVGDRCWRTTNVLVDAEGVPDADPAAIERLWAAARHAASAAPAAAAAPPLPRADARPAAEWQGLVADAVRAIRESRFEKVVLAREVRVSAPRALDVAAILRHLRAAHPDGYVFGVWRQDRAFVGASPERLVRLEAGEVRASSLAGSVRRGTTAEEDAALAARLLGSAKDRAEHEVVRRTLCAGLAQLCDEVTAEPEPSLLSLPNVHHLHTEVRARLRPGHSLLRLVERLHPTPAVGGAPREAALRFIRQHEQLDRGWYAAPLGWLQRDRGDFAVGLRSALVVGSEASLYAGCGIVADSDPAREHAESLLKLRPMELALAAAAASAAASEGAR